MSQPTDLTAQISHLRDRHPKDMGEDQPHNQKQRPAASSKSRERTFATDYFMLFVYSLLGIAMTCQLSLIVWLDII
jgi:hypothetical protein